MKIHLVSGFLGSGKTTAIANACKVLSDKGIITSVITNDQGEYLVDSRFIQYSKIPNAEVTGGCFCCNYNQLDTQINTLKNAYNPSVMFAEFVGSCTDLVATVLKPLLEFRVVENEQVTFSSFVDSQLFLMYLEDKAIPFSLETKYIWEKQIEEAEVLVINKIDLLSAKQLKKLKLLCKDLYTSKILHYQNSFDINSVNEWIEIITNKINQEHKTIEIDYIKYGKGEANLAWLDEEIEIISSNNSSVELTFDFIEKITDDIVRKGLTIGHLKFFLSFNGKSEKLSYTTISDKSTKESLVQEKAMSVDLLINARIQTTPDELRKILFDNLFQLKSIDGVQVNEKFLSYFQPGFPNPTHRIS